jgi:hypothetical protein
MATGKVNIDFYALGVSPQNVQIPKMTFYNAFKDHSNDLLNRNRLSLNSNNLENLRNTHKSQSILLNAKTDTNNYMDPIGIFKSTNNYNISNNMVNMETYRLTKDKLFAK